MSVTRHGPSGVAARVAAVPPGDAPDDVDPLDRDVFAGLMDPLGPFEDRPHLALGVSGGRDSLALALCAAEWVRARGGCVAAVTVDHGLRPESAAEARQAGEWLAAQGIAHHVLEWAGPRPETGIEAAAREARYALLAEFCRAYGILHLLVGHHAADQAETVLIRRARRSGADGLAGMAAVRETPDLRILRPFLDVPRARITATLLERGLNWIEDPSNSDTRFARAAIRHRGGAQTGADSVSCNGVARASRDGQMSSLAARVVTLHPAGYALVDGAALAAAPAEIASRLVGALARTISGSPYPPRGTRLDRFMAILSSGSLDRARTLGGCVFRPLGPKGFIVLREFAGIGLAEPFKTGSQERALWDGRFRIDPEQPLSANARLGALGGFVASPAEAGLSDNWRRALPYGAWRGLPAVESGGDVRVFGISSLPDPGLSAGAARFAPTLPLSGARFARSG